MSILSAILGLVIPSTDENFNLEDHFNVNWRKLDTEVGAIKYRTGDYNVYSKTKVGDVYTLVEYKRQDDTMYAKSVLSNPDGNGRYLTDTLTTYALDGLTPVSTTVWTLTYDTDDNVVSRIKA